MATTPTYINQRINNLQAQINALQPYPPPELQTLTDVLILGNSAGLKDINMNSQDILAVDNINLTTINGSAYPPVVAVPTINAVLGAGNTAIDKTQIFTSSTIAGRQVAINNQVVNFFNSNINFTTTAEADKIEVNETFVGSIRYMPSFTLPAISNQAIQIPPFSVVPHQVVLQSAPVPVIDTLVATAWTIPSGEQVNTFAFAGGSYMYLGCESGNVYYFEASTQSWDLVLTFDGSVRCLYYHTDSGKLYFGGRFDNLLYPFFSGGLNKVCYSNSYPLLGAGLTVDVWANYGVSGFDDAVNAIAGDANFLYFGGAFKYNSNFSLNCEKIACFDWNISLNLYALDGIGGTGFNAPVFGLALAQQVLCVTGEFTNLATALGGQTVFYCVALGMNGFLVTSTDYLYNNATILTVPINTYDSVKTDGGTFFISTRDANIGGFGANYMIQAPYNPFGSSGFIGANAFATPQTSFNLQTSVGSVGGDAIYLTNGTIFATLPFTPYIYWNYTYGRQEFINLGSGQIYAFTGSTSNNFTLQAGRSINFTGTNYTGGWNIGNSGNGLGWSATLYWNGTYYSPSGIPYGNAYT